MSEIIDDTQTQPLEAEKDNSADILAALRMRKAPEMVSIKGLVAEGVAEALRSMAKAAKVKEEDIVGMAVTDHIHRAQRRLSQKTQKKQVEA